MRPFGTWPGTSHRESHICMPSEKAAVETLVKPKSTTTGDSEPGAFSFEAAKEFAEVGSPKEFKLSVTDWLLRGISENRHLVNGFPDTSRYPSDESRCAASDRSRDSEHEDPGGHATENTAAGAEHGAQVRDSLIHVIAVRRSRAGHSLIHDQIPVSD